jgi:RNA polymerase sigma-70 factor (ECF subfamily)
MYTEKQLIRKVKKHGDRQAANELVSCYYDEIYAFAYRQTTDVELAMDLTQEIFIAMLKGISSFDEKKAKFRTWLYRIASNKITDYYRSKYHKQQICDIYGEEVEEQTTGYDVEEDILQKVYEEQLMIDVMSIIVEYGNEWVRIFQMKLFLDKTFEEISIELKLSENTIKTRYYTMLKKLRKEIQI